MGAPFVGVNVIDKRIHGLGILCSVLNRNFHLNFIPFPFDVDRFMVRLFPFVQKAHKFLNASLVGIGVFYNRALVLHNNFHALVEKCQFAKPACDRVKIKDNGFKNLLVRKEGNGRA